MWQEGDVGLASLSITYSRYQAIDYTSWLQFHPSLFVTRGPRYLKDPLAVFRLYTWQVRLVLLHHFFHEGRNRKSVSLGKLR